MTTQNKEVQIHQVPFSHATSMGGETKPIIRWNIPLGSARIAVVWCPHCDYSQQVTLSDACTYCRAHYSRRVPAEDEPMSVGVSEVQGTESGALVCSVCGRDDFASAIGLGSHMRAHKKSAEALQADKDDESGQVGADEGIQAGI